jgi:hypothetical protein
MKMKNENENENKTFSSKASIIPKCANPLAPPPPKTNPIH